MPANWTAPIEVGDASVPVTGLSELQMRLFVHKADATVWALQGGIDTGTARNLTPDLRESRDPENGKRPAAWLGALYFRAGDTLWRFTGHGRGAHRARAPGGQHLPRAGPRGGLLRLRGLVRPGRRLQRHHCRPATSCSTATGCPAEETSPAGGAHQFVPAWDGSLCDLPGKRVTALHVTTHESVVGAPPTGGNPLLLVGFRDGTYGWLRLPQGRPLALHPGRPPGPGGLHRPAGVPAPPPAQPDGPRGRQGLPLLRRRRAGAGRGAVGGGGVPGRPGGAGGALDGTCRGG